MQRHDAQNWGTGIELQGWQPRSSSSIPGQGWSGVLDRQSHWEVCSSQKVCNTTHPGTWHLHLQPGQQLQRTVSENGQGLSAPSTSSPHRPPPSWALCTEKQRSKKEEADCLLMQQLRRHMAAAAEPGGSCPRPPPRHRLHSPPHSRPPERSGAMLMSSPPHH